MSALVAALEHTERDTGISLTVVQDLEPYWESVRRLYSPFESGLPGPTGRVYRHEIPGGQLSNLRQQAISLGLGDRFEDIENMYAAADRILGRLVKVTPSSKVVGDLALQLVGTGADPAEFEADPASFDLPESVIGFLEGELGDPPGGWPEPFRSNALKGRKPSSKIHTLTKDDLEGLIKPGKRRRRRLNHLLFPGPTKEYEAHKAEYADISVIDTFHYLYGMTVGSGEEVTIDIDKGVKLLLSLEAMGQVDDHGNRTAMFNHNGQIRPVTVRDEASAVIAMTREKADPKVKGEIAAPFAGAVTPAVEMGAVVAAGDTVATIEAMKMEAAITTPIAGKVMRMLIHATENLTGGDLVVVVQ
jgi:pyruvate carboxylase